MIDDDLHRLDAREPDHSLDQLEFDVWDGLARRARERASARRTVSLQGAIMMLALVVSAAMGIGAVRPATVTAGANGLLNEGIELMPSTLLLGDRP